MTTLEKAAKRPVEYAKKWIGYKEKNSPYNLESLNAANDGNGNFTIFGKYFNDLRNSGKIDFYGGNAYTEWCVIFVHWAQCQAWGPKLALQVLRTPSGSPQSRGVRYAAQYYMNVGQFIYGNESNGVPKVGDQIFFGNGPNSWKHTGIVAEVTNEQVKTIEGNANNKVELRIYDRKYLYIRGYGRPNYSLVLDQIDNEENTNIEESKKEDSSYTLSQEEINKQKQYITDLINTYEIACQNYNKGIIDEKQLEQAKKDYNDGSQKYYDYYDKVKYLVENISAITENIITLQSAKFTEISILEHKKNLGSTDWFYKFKDSYNILIKDFSDQINNLYQLFFTLKQNNNIIIDDSIISICPTIPKPLETNQDSIIYIWQKMFSGNYSTSNFLSQYVDNNTHIVNYDEASYDGYNSLLDYYDNIINNLQEEINKYSLELNADALVQCLLDKLQAEIYKLYAVTYGKIEKINLDNTISFYKTGISYDFGEENVDYQNFYQIGKDTIFGSNLYLDEIDISTIKEIISNIIKAQNDLLENNKMVADNLLAAQKSYNNIYKEIRQQALLACQSGKTIPVDWRELIYQMAKDYYNYANNPKYDYNYLLWQNNSDILQHNGTTGYEVFYTDVLGLWRYLYYNPFFEKNDYDIEEATAKALTIYDFCISTNWINKIYTAPSELTFWFDLTEGSGEISNYQISTVGDRTKTIKDTKVTTLYSADIPDIVYYEQNDVAYLQENYSIANYSSFQLGGPLSDVYSVSSQGRSAFDLLQELLYKFIYCVETISITSLPIYTLQPNYRIIIYSRISGLSGEYILTKYSIPLAYNATMSISATRAVPYIGING